MTFAADCINYPATSYIQWLANTFLVNMAHFPAWRSHPHRRQCGASAGPAGAGQHSVWQCRHAWRLHPRGCHCCLSQLQLSASLWPQAAHHSASRGGAFLFFWRAHMLAQLDGLTHPPMHTHTHTITIYTHASFVSERLTVISGCKTPSGLVLHSEFSHMFIHSFTQ